MNCRLSIVEPLQKRNCESYSLNRLLIKMRSKQFVRVDEIDMFVHFGVDTFCFLAQEWAKENTASPDFRETLRSDREACCELAQQRQHCIFLTDI